jgi:hypothetical protein
VIHDPDPADGLIPLAPAPGASLDPAQILGRGAAAAQAFELLEHTSLLLNEPRRLGKTCLLTVMASAPPPGWKVVNQSFQGVGSTREMVEYALSGIAGHGSLGAKAKKAAKRVLSSTAVRTTTADGFVFELAPRFADDPLDALSAALVDVGRSLDESEFLLLAWDEVPDMAKAIADSEGDAAARRALGILRRLREETGGPQSRIRWILTGSVGFHHVLGQVGRHDLVNDLGSLGLGPLDEAWSLHLAERLLRGAGLDPEPEMVDAVSTTAGRIPVLIHLIAAEGKFRAQAIIDAKDVDQLFCDAVGNLDRSHQFTSFLTRLGPYYGDHEDAAAWVLDALAASPLTRPELARRAPGRFGFTRGDALRQLLDWLMLDHYIERTGTGGELPTYRWRYEPLRRIWELRRA